MKAPFKNTQRIEQIKFADIKYEKSANGLVEILVCALISFQAITPGK
jgi:hypothetical protein